jgi:ArsR family transcriptional regulator, arsenate/arsenite/antimonite-responsive transcriptional repressor
LVHRLDLFRQSGRNDCALSDTFAGIDPAHVPGFILAQVAGALTGAQVMQWMTHGGGDQYFYNSRNIIDRRVLLWHASIMKIDDAAARLEALGNPTRLKIFRALVRAGGNGLSVGKLQMKLDMAASTLSHHLKSMMIVGLIAQERHSTTLICRANYDVMRSLLDFLVEECCAESACETSEGKSKVA